MSIDLGDAKYTVKLDDKATAKMNSLSGSMKNMGAQMKKVGVVMAAVAAAVTAAFGKMLHDWAAAGDEVAKMAKRTGWSTEALSEMRHAAKLSGTDINSLEKAVKRMSSTIEDAKDGLETYTRSFDKLGLSVEEVARLAPEDQFWAIANAIANLEDVTMQAALAQDFFGRAGTDMLPMLAAGAEGIAEMRQQAHDLGLVFSEEAAVSAEGMSDAMTALKGSMAGLRNAVVEDLAPVLTDLIETQIIPAVTSLKDWARENDATLESLVRLIGAVATLVGLIATLYAKLVALGEWFGRHKGMWDVLSALHPMIFWPKNIQESLFGAQGPALQPGIEEQYGGMANAVMAGGGGGITVNIGSYMGDETSRRELMRDLEDMMGQDGRRTSFSSVNSLGYFPGSSAP